MSMSSKPTLSQSRLALVPRSLHNLAAAPVIRPKDRSRDRQSRDSETRDCDVIN